MSSIDCIYKVLQLPKLSQKPLLSIETVTNYKKVNTIADPFPLIVTDKIYVFAEIEGKRLDDTYFKKIGIFDVSLDLKSVNYLGETWSGDDEYYSFPYIIEQFNSIYLMPEVSSLENGSKKKFKIYECPMDSLPFGWTRIHEFSLPELKTPSDKVLLKIANRWFLFISDAGFGGQLLLYTSLDMKRWEAHPMNPILRRGLWQRLFNRLLPYRLYPTRPWRLGGGAIYIDGLLVLFVQHMYHKKVYGEAVSPIVFTKLDQKSMNCTIGTKPLLIANPSTEWRSVAAHHLAFAIHKDSLFMTTDGFNGKEWNSTILSYRPPSGISFKVPGDC